MKKIEKLLVFSVLSLMFLNFSFFSCSATLEDAKEFVENAYNPETRKIDFSSISNPEALEDILEILPVILQAFTEKEDVEGIKVSNDHEIKLKLSNERSHYGNKKGLIDLACHIIGTMNKFDEMIESEKPYILNPNDDKIPLMLYTYKKGITEPHVQIEQIKGHEILHIFVPIIETIVENENGKPVAKRSLLRWIAGSFTTGGMTVYALLKLFPWLLALL